VRDLVSRRLLQLSGAVFGQKLLHNMWSVCGRIVVVQDPVAIPPFFRSFSANWFTQTSQDLQVEFLVNCLPVGSVLVVYDTLRIKNMTIVFFAPGAPSLVAETWDPSTVTIVYYSLHLHRMLAAIIDMFPLRVFRFKKRKIDANALFGTFTHRKNRYYINARVTSATYYNQLSKRSHLQLELLRHVRTCQDWLQTHPTQWTTTTVPIRILFEQTSYITTKIQPVNAQVLLSRLRRQLHISAT